VPARSVRRAVHSWLSTTDEYPPVSRVRRDV
jgi:hypothetical protein